MKVFDVNSNIVTWICPLGLAFWIMKRDSSPWCIVGSFVDENQKVVFNTMKGHHLGNTGAWFMYDRELDIKFNIRELEYKLEKEREKLRSVMDKDEDDDEYDDY